MINIELPNPSKRVFLSEYNSVQNTSGFYIMRNIKSEIIYKGESQNIRKRLGKHFRGKSGTTMSFKHLFCYVDILYSHASDRKIYEIYAINLYNPLGNVWGNCNMNQKQLKKRRKEWIRVEEDKQKEIIKDIPQRVPIKLNNVKKEM